MALTTSHDALLLPKKNRTDGRHLTACWCPDCSPGSIKEKRNGFSVVLPRLMKNVLKSVETIPLLDKNLKSCEESKS